MYLKLSTEDGDDDDKDDDDDDDDLLRDLSYCLIYNIYIYIRS